MSYGRRDIYHSRRGMFRRCIFWNKIEDAPMSKLNELILNKKPDGEFMARESNAQSEQGNAIAGVFMVDRKMVTLESDDDLTGLEKDCIVLYDNHAWMVQSVQKMVHHKESEFMKKVDYRWYISLRR